MGTPPLRPQPSWRRRLVATFTEHLVLKATAIFVAVVLWFVVNAKEPQVELVRVRFVAVLDSSLVLRDAPPELQALVAGSPKELIKLNTAAPVVRRQVTADAPDTLVLDLRPGDVTLPEGVDAVVRDIQPRSITLRFESTWSRRVPVRSAIDLVRDSSRTPLAISLDPDTVQVSGPRHVVLGVPFVRTVRTTIRLPDSLPHLVDLDTARLGVRVKPSQVRVQITPYGVAPGDSARRPLATTARPDSSR